jgi:hypothetical protein
MPAKTRMHFGGLHNGAAGNDFTYAKGVKRDVFMDPDRQRDDSDFGKNCLI